MKDGTNSFVQSEGTRLYLKLQEQATLTAAKEVTGLIIIAGMVWLIFLFFRYMHKVTNASSPSIKTEVK
jgi:hypothetical protein